MNLRKVKSAFDHLKVLKRHRFMKIGSVEAAARKVTFPDGTILVNSKRQVDALRVLLEIQGSKLARPVLLINKSMGWDPEIVAKGFQYELVPAGPRPGRRTFLKFCSFYGRLLSCAGPIDDKDAECQDLLKKFESWAANSTVRVRDWAELCFLKFLITEKGIAVPTITISRNLKSLAPFILFKMMAKDLGIALVDHRPVPNRRG